MSLPYLRPSARRLAPVTVPTIFAMGGGGDTDEQTRALTSTFCSLARRPRPRVLYVPTASAESAEGIVRIYGHLRGLADVSHLSFFPWPPADLRSFALEHDVILV